MGRGATDGPASHVDFFNLKVRQARKLAATVVVKPLDGEVVKSILASSDFREALFKSA